MLIFSIENGKLLNYIFSQFVYSYGMRLLLSNKELKIDVYGFFSHLIVN